jgi:hypothetical protein
MADFEIADDTADGGFMIPARFPQNPTTWKRIRETLRLPHDRFGPIDLSIDPDSGQVIVHLELFATPDEFRALADIAAGDQT